MNFTEKENYNFNDLVEIVKSFVHPTVVRGTENRLTSQSAQILLRKPMRLLRQLIPTTLICLKKNSVMFFCRLLCMRKSKVNREHLI